MKKNSTKLFCGILGASLALSMGISLASAIPVTSFADTPSVFSTSSSSFSVKMFDKNNVELTSDRKETHVKGTTYGYYTTNWKDLSHFQVYFPTEMTGIVTENEYTLSLKWIPLEISASGVNFETDILSTGTVQSGTFSEISQVETPFKVYIDDLGGKDNKSAGDILKDKDNSTKTYLDNGGWGIYQFEMVVNATTYYSDLYEVKPTSVSSIDGDPAPLPQIKEVAVRSNYLIDNAYQISLTDESSAYKYIKRDQIKWYVEGEAANGTKYVLRPSDIGQNTKLKSLLTDESNDYIGTTMKFDFNLSGTWKVYCQIVNEENPEDVRTSNYVEFSTVTVIPSTTIIWIIVAAVVAAGIILTIIIVLTKKKEKTW